MNGSYLETQKSGQPARSNDGTIEIIEKYKDHPKVHILYKNELSDPQQRNACLEEIKKTNPDGWLMIWDADEVYGQNALAPIRALTKNYDRQDIKRSLFSFYDIHKLTRYLLPARFPSSF